eukprot:1157524-Pelagomonas_calceolata.AAC.2
MEPITHLSNPAGVIQVITDPLLASREIVARPSSHESGGGQENGLGSSHRPLPLALACNRPHAFNTPNVVADVLRVNALCEATAEPLRSVSCLFLLHFVKPSQSHSITWALCIRLANARISQLTHPELKQLQCNCNTVVTRFNAAGTIGCSPELAVCVEEGAFAWTHQRAGMRKAMQQSTAPRYLECKRQGNAA